MPGRIWKPSINKHHEDQGTTERSSTKHEKNQSEKHHVGKGNSQRHGTANVLYVLLTVQLFSHFSMMEYLVTYSFNHIYFSSTKKHYKMWKSVKGGSSLVPDTVLCGAGVSAQRLPLSCFHAQCVFIVLKFYTEVFGSSGNSVVPSTHHNTQIAKLKAWNLIICFSVLKLIAFISLCSVKNDMTLYRTRAY